jgi:hypothetical protein
MRRLKAIPVSGATAPTDATLITGEDLALLPDVGPCEVEPLGASLELRVLAAERPARDERNPCSC